MCTFWNMWPFKKFGSEALLPMGTTSLLEYFPKSFADEGAFHIWKWPTTVDGASRVSRSRNTCIASSTTWCDKHGGNNTM